MKDEASYFKTLMRSFRSINKKYRRFGVGPLEAVVIILVCVAVFAGNTLFLAADRFDDRPVKVTVPEKVAERDISKILYTNKIISNTRSFDLSALLLNVSSKLKAGTYYFSPDMSNYTLLMMMKEGRAIVGGIRFIVPEGTSIYKISVLLEKAGIKVTGGSFQELSREAPDRELIIKYTFLADPHVRSLEGYLFPDTYMLPKVVSREMLGNIMLDRFKEMVIPVYLSSGIRALSLNQLLTLASIIEKEAERDEERPVIASVFYNRLESGMPLRADPTVKYALSHPGKRVYFRDLQVDSPYNTYRNKGLPPGPICNPGLKSILAAMHPASTDYFYFVSNGDGTHTFSRTWGQHEKAVSKYRKTKQ